MKYIITLSSCFLVVGATMSLLIWFANYLVNNKVTPIIATISIMLALIIGVCFMVFITYFAIDYLTK